MKKRYCITLDEEFVNKANKKIEPFGGKFSRLLNTLLEEFIKDGRTNN
jgi:hypothetical protein